MYMMYICSMFLSCLCKCALFVCSSHVEEIKNIIIVIIIILFRLRADDGPRLVVVGSCKYI